MSFPRYPAYKDSGVEWLGRIPKHWNVQPFKHQIARNDGGVWGDDPDGINDTFVLRSTEQTVDGHWKIDDPAPRKLSESEINSSLLAENDLLLTKSSGSSLHIGKTTLVTAEIAAMRCCYSNFMQRIRMAATFLPKLAWFVMNNDLARLQFDLASNSSTGLANLNATMVGQIVVPVAPLQEQTAIAAFLDRETAKIDALVAEQEKLIALLQEKRQAVISHAVTKGLDPNVPMKDSGVEWLGEVPGHWEVTPVRWAAKCRSGDGVSSAEIESVEDEEHQIPAIGGNGLMGYTSHSNISHAVLAIGRVGALCGNVHIVNVPAWITDNALILDPEPEIFDLQFMSLVLRTRNLNDIAAKTAQPLITGTQVSDQRLPCPPLSEQRMIYLYVETETKKFDGLTDQAKSAITLLQERRTALISAAVTGQIDVRGLVGSANAPDSIAASAYPASAGG